jgi:hypothetical protein
MAESIATYSYTWPSPPGWSWVCELYPDNLTITGRCGTNFESHVHTFREYASEPSVTVKKVYDVKSTNLGFLYTLVVMTQLGFGSQEIPAFAGLPFQIQAVIGFGCFLAIFAVFEHNLGTRYTSTEVRFPKRFGPGFFSMYSPHQAHDEEFMEFLNLLQNTMKRSSVARPATEIQHV